MSPTRNTTKATEKGQKWTQKDFWRIEMWQLARKKTVYRTHTKRVLPPAFHYIYSFLFSFLQRTFLASFHSWELDINPRASNVSPPSTQGMPRNLIFVSPGGTLVECHLSRNYPLTSVSNVSKLIPPPTRKCEPEKKNISWSKDQITVTICSVKNRLSPSPSIFLHTKNPVDPSRGGPDLFYIYLFVGFYGHFR